MFFFFYLIAMAYAIPNPEVSQNSIQNLENPAKIIEKECLNGIFSSTCLKISVISVLEKINSKDEIQVIPGVSLVKDIREDIESLQELAKSLPSKAEERLDKYLLYRVGTFLDTHSVKFRLLDEGSVEETRALVGEARGSNSLSLGGKKGGNAGVLAALALMMKVPVN